MCGRSSFTHSWHARTQRGSESDYPHKRKEKLLLCPAAGTVLVPGTPLLLAASLLLSKIDCAGIKKSAQNCRELDQSKCACDILHSCSFCVPSKRMDRQYYFKLLPESAKKLFISKSLKCKLLQNWMEAISFRTNSNQQTRRNTTQTQNQKHS